MMVLPPDLEQNFNTELKQLEEANRMTFITPHTREGINIGRKLGTRENIIKSLRFRLNNIPATLIKEINELDDQVKLDRLFDQTFLVNSVAEFEQALAEEKLKPFEPYVDKNELRGMLKNTKELLLIALSNRFLYVPEVIQQRINLLNNLPHLKELFNYAMTAQSLEEFESQIGFF